MSYRDAHLCVSSGREPRVHDAPPPRLVIAAGAEWFQVGAQPRVILETRVPLRRLLIALGELKLHSPEAVLPVTAAFEAGWPGERASPAAAAMRVYTAVHSLRRFGLRGLLVRRRRGYVLDIDVHFAANESQFPPAVPSPLDAPYEDIARSA
ncbi:MAG: hypothetical protein BGO98_47225 [Myxococcales bacterium 68-20]|nr:hypothetical protein [Myxococcales bacterium]OJY29453.1 MAG: hypothetical protein BGO98_47225 [Myxococcales bacterium 68-20]